MSDEVDFSSVESLVDHHRWLLNNGIVHDSIKNQLFMYGSIVHKNVLALELSVEVEKKTITYKIYLDSKTLKKISKFNNLKNDNSFLGLFLLKRFIKKEGNLDFKGILGTFIKDYCGPNWLVTLEILDFNNYKEEEINDSNANVDIRVN